MHALPLLATLVDPLAILLRQTAWRPNTGARFGDEPNPEARLFLAVRRNASPERPR